MRNIRALLLVPVLAVIACQPGKCQQPAREILRSSTDRDALERAASALARSGDPRDLALLGQLLRDHGFLARLDDLNGLKTRHLSRVMEALTAHPTASVVELCLTLAEDPVFVAEGDRKSFVLELLAAVKPMGEPAAAIFQRSNEEGYFAFNATRLAANGSPRAVALFESMMRDRSVPIETRVECLHKSIVPHRIEAPILRMADRILSRTQEPAIATGVIESVFDFQLEWFGIEAGVSKPPDWRRASAESRRLALRMAGVALARSDLHARLRDTVRRARDLLQTPGARWK